MFLRVIFQYLIFFIGKVIETVHENGFINLFFNVLTLKCELFLAKNSFFQGFWQLKLYYLNVFTVKFYRNHHSSQNWACY